MTKDNRSGKDWGRFDFLRWSNFFTVVTGLIVAASLALMAVKGLKYGVDFAGGIELQVHFENPVEAGRVRQFMEQSGHPQANVQALGSENEYLIYIQSVENAHEKSDAQENEEIQAIVQKLKSEMTTHFAAEKADVVRVDTVGPQIGAELKRNGILAGFYCFLLILIYIGLRFDYRYAPAAVFCLFHDAIVTMGIYSLFQWEFTVQTLAAVLTIIGYSLNDTIVIFDRIRENVVVHRDKNLYWISNRSINETLSRTILTTLTTGFMVVAMYVLADGAIQDFSRAMLIGMVLGVFSTVYVATPLMLMADKYQKSKRKSLQAA